MDRFMSALHIHIHEYVSSRAAKRGEHISPRRIRPTEGFSFKRNSRTRCTASRHAIVEIVGGKQQEKGCSSSLRRVTVSRKSGVGASERR